MIEVNLIRKNLPSIVYPVKDDDEAKNYINKKMSDDINIIRAKYVSNGKTILITRRV